MSCAPSTLTKTTHTHTPPSAETKKREKRFVQSRVVGTSPPKFLESHGLLAVVPANTNRHPSVALRGPREARWSEPHVFLLPLTQRPEKKGMGSFSSRKHHLNKHTATPPAGFSAPTATAQRATVCRRGASAPARSAPSARAPPAHPCAGARRTSRSARTACASRTPTPPWPCPPPSAPRCP